jgi:hypothetical protein
MSSFKRRLAAEKRKITYWKKRFFGKAKLPPLDPRDRPIVAALRRDGACVTSLDSLGIAGTAAMLAAADRLAAATLGRKPGKGGFNIQPAQDEIESCPDLIAWGLDERLLGLAAHYIGLPVAYRGLTVRRDIVGGEATETRLWHYDDEDFRIVKVILYLNDVGPDGGPFEYIPKPAAPAAWHFPEGYGRMEDADLVRLAPRDTWVTCAGRRGTAVIADTCGIPHRGRISGSEDRLALFFCYNSITPLHPEWCRPLFDRTIFQRSGWALSPLQAAALAYA